MTVVARFKVWIRKITQKMRQLGPGFPRYEIFWEVVASTNTKTRIENEAAKTRSTSTVYH